jgi:hypothetical protein
MLQQLFETLREYSLGRGIETRLVADLLKFNPIGVRTRILLELGEYRDGNVYIYRHRDPELTERFRKRHVSEAWVRGFIDHNQALARQVTAEAIEASARAASVTIQRVPLRAECEQCHGEGRWFVGSLRDGDTAFEVCAACHGAGWIDQDRG